MQSMAWAEARTRWMCRCWKIGLLCSKQHQKEWCKKQEKKKKKKTTRKTKHNLSENVIWDDMFTVCVQCVHCLHSQCFTGCKCPTKLNIFNPYLSRQIQLSWHTLVIDIYCHKLLKWSIQRCILKCTDWACYDSWITWHDAVFQNSDIGWISVVMFSILIIWLKQCEIKAKKPELRPADGRTLPLAFVYIFIPTLCFSLQCCLPVVYTMYPYTFKLPMCVLTRSLSLIVHFPRCSLLCLSLEIPCS